MLESLRERVEVFWEAAARDRCLFEVEERSEIPIGSRYVRAGALFHHENIREVQRALAGASGAEEKQLRFLLEFLAVGHSRCVVAGELDRLHAWFAHATVVVRERSFSLRSIPSVLQRTADPLIRSDLNEALLSALDEQFQLLEGLAARQRDAVEELGYGSFVESCEFLRGVDLRGLAREAERFLTDTDPLCRDLVTWYLPRLTGVEAVEATEADGVRLAEAEPYSEYFADPRMLARVQAALLEAGLDPGAGGRLRTTTRSDLPGGSGAVCCALRIPDEVVLTVAQQPGRPSQASILFGLGYALHRVFTAADLPVELRYLGDGAIPIGYARTWEGLLSNSLFVSRVCGIPRVRLADYLRMSALLDLLRIRRSAALLQVELTAFEEMDARDTAHRYAELLSQATGVRHDARGAFWAIRQPLRVSAELRGEQWSATLTHYLRSRFDEDWWRNPRCGPELRTLFQAGSSYTAGEMSVQLESQSLSFGRVRESLEERL